MDRDADSRYILDMTQCEPHSAISRAFEHGKWTSVNYAVEAGTGRMLFCGPDTDAPPLTLKLNAKGWHAIYVGTFRGHHFQSDDLVLFLRLTGDPGTDAPPSKTSAPARTSSPRRCSPARRTSPRPTGSPRT